MSPLKLGKVDTLEMERHHNDREDLHYHHSDVKVLLIPFIKKNYQADFRSIYEYNFNAFSS